MFHFPNHTLKLKAPDQLQSEREESLLTGDITYRYFLYHTLFKFFIKIESNYFSKMYSEIKSMWPIKSSKEEIVLSSDSKELLEQRFVKVFNQNRKHVEAQNQRTDTPATVPCWDCQKQSPELLYKKTILKNFAISTGNTCVGVYF